ncbi:MAG: FHA domain-containing protein [Planctomycetes bacterium]|nr:FHA domain-containing protein [Planctomycetota bacterium]
MGRIQSALDRAEAKRRRTNLEKSGLAPVITVEHLDGDARGFRRSFRQQAIMLGRGDHNDVPFDPFVDATVSAQHAQIRVEGDEVLLYDMGSLNGCFVAGQRVRRARIEDGVEFRLGRSGPRLRVGIGALTEIGDPRPARIHGDPAVAVALPDTAEALLPTRGVFTVTESLLLGAVLLAVLVDLALGLSRAI